MIVPATPIVPRDQDHGVIPIELSVRALRLRADGIDDRGHPRWPRPIRLSGMIGLEAKRNDPVHLFKVALADVGENVGGKDRVDITVRLAFSPVRTGTDS